MYIFSVKIVTGHSNSLYISHRPDNRVRSRRNEFETWSFLFDLQTSHRHPYRIPDLNSRTDEEREERNHATLFHYDPIKSYGTRARTIYDALNVT